MEHPPTSDEASPPARAPVSRSVLGVGAAIAALIALALVVVLVVPRGPASYDTGSPEAAFQAFFQAYEVGDIESAYGLLGSTVRDRLTIADYRRLDAEHAWQRDEDRRVVLLGTDLTGDRANLRLRIDQFSGGGLGGNRYSHDRTIRLVREQGVWLIDEPIIGIENVSYAY